MRVQQANQELHGGYGFCSRTASCGPPPAARIGILISVLPRCDRPDPFQALVTNIPICCSCCAYHVAWHACLPAPLHVCCSWQRSPASTPLSSPAPRAGHSKEKMRKDIGRKRYFTPLQAIDYGIIDKIVQPMDQAIEINKVSIHYKSLLPFAAYYFSPGCA